MPTWLKNIWIIAIVVNSVSLVWFLLGTTANFQRSMDLVELLTLVLIWLPSLLLVVVSIKILKNKKLSISKSRHVAVNFIIFLLFSLSIPLFIDVNTGGWLYDDIESDSLKLTSDGKYKYRIELINMDQKNSREQLYVRNISTDEESIYQLILIQTN